MKRVLIMLASACLVTTDVVAATGMIKIKAEPGPASITIDGKRYQDATEEARVYELSPGRHIIRAAKQYYNSQEKTVTIRANEVAPTVIFRFEKASGFKVDRPDQATAGQGRGDLSVFTDQPGATVRLNGRNVDVEGGTPVTVRDLGEGEWDIEVSLRGNTLKDVVLIRPGKLATVRFFFDPKKKAAHLRELEKERLAKAEQERLREIDRLVEVLKKTLRELSNSYLTIKGTPNDKLKIRKDRTASTKTAGVFNWEEKWSESMSSEGKTTVWSLDQRLVRDLTGKTHSISIEYSVDIDTERNAHYSYSRGGNIIPVTEKRGPSYGPSTGKYICYWNIEIDGKRYSKSLDITKPENGSGFLTWEIEFPWGKLISQPSTRNTSWETDKIKNCHVSIYGRLPLGSTEATVEEFRTRLQSSDAPLILDQYEPMKLMAVK